MQPVDTPTIKTQILTHGQNLTDAVHLLDRTLNDWQSRLLVLIATESLAQCQELLGGLDAQSMCRIAWATRSMLELHYFVRFIIESPENAQRFREDMVCDYQDLITACAKHPQYAGIVNDVQQILDHFWDKHLKFTKKKDKYLKPEAIAKGLGEGHYYATTAKFLSKFVHPTAISIQFRTAEPWKAMFISSSTEVAGHLVGDTFPRLADYIRGYVQNVQENL